MTKLSRTEKYRELRDSLQNDTAPDINSKELSRFSNRLNQIDADNFAAPQDYANDDHNAVHARNTTYEEPAYEPEPENDDPVFDLSMLGRNENYTSSFENDYLDQYIREVKQYNIDQGNALSDNTQVNVLRQLNDGRQQRRRNPAPSTPYPRQNEAANAGASRNAQAARNPQPERNTQTARSTQAARNTQVNRNTTDIPFTGARRPKTREEFYDYEDTQKSMTKEDIMAEVQNLVNGTSSQPLPDEHEDTADEFVGTDTFNRMIEQDRKERQQLLNATTQIRAQIDGYEDDLNEVSDKMRHTNQILNLVLIVLIVALLIILAIVIYWIIIVRA